MPVRRAKPRKCCRVWRESSVRHKQNGSPSRLPFLFGRGCDGACWIAFAGKPRSYIDRGCSHHLRLAPIPPVGARLAREEANTFNLTIGAYTAIASRLAPTFDRGCLHHLRLPPIPPVGARLAREEASTFNPAVGSYTAIASRLAPTFDRGCLHHLRLPPIPLWERACSR
ncbi:hypothetical protein PMI18_05191 [Pseudomonas sp. GM102]|nr:hypothetical protein PMI18_05191 [Pseudomonas sp. GM102]